MTTEPESDAELLQRITAASATIEVATRNKKNAEAELLARRKPEIEKLLKAKDEPFGKVDIIVGNHKVQITTPKKVEYSQPALKAIAKQMVAEGVDPEIYIKIEYDISENTYKAWPQEMRDYFADARTVKPGSASLKVVEEKDA